MAPEQLHGQPASVASDQYAFCVSLFEALYGRRPFNGKTVDALLEDIARPRVPLPTTVVALARPGARARRLERGLSLDYAARYPSMQEVAGALAPPRRRARVPVALGLAACLVAAATAIGWQVHRERTLCAGASEELRGVWGEPRQASIAAAFVRAGGEGARGTWNAVRGQLDRYAGDWIAARTTSCQATLVRHQQSAHLFDAQMQCLARRKDDLTALVDVLGQVDGRELDAVPRAVSELRPVAACAGTDWASIARPPRAAADEAAARADEGLASRAEAFIALGRLDRARPLAERLQASAAARRDCGAEAEALNVLARIAHGQHRRDDALALTRGAYTAADAGGNDRARFEAALWSLEWSAEKHDAAESANWRALAEAVCDRAGAGSRARARQSVGQHRRRRPRAR